jgi:hypothetical protein
VKKKKKGKKRERKEKKGRRRGEESVKCPDSPSFLAGGRFLA